MIRNAILAVLALVCVALPAEARQRHAPGAERSCVPTSDVMHPCAYQPNFLAGVKEIRVTMHREGKTGRASARRRESSSYSVPGIVRSVSGVAARVAASATQAFQCFVDALDRQGYPIRALGGWRAHGSVPGSLHPAGLAMDVNQVARNVTKPAMPSNEIALANGCGLISGRQWRSADSGHEQLGGWAGWPRHNRYAAR